MFGLDLPEGWAAASGFAIWEENAPALEAFLSVDTQWVSIPKGQSGVKWIGLHYGNARDGLAMAGIELTPETWAEVRLIEAGATEELNRDQ
ncbi:MAG: DUF1799 domain-containing protein [Pseudodonghicola sp.]